MRKIFAKVILLFTIIAISSFGAVCGKSTSAFTLSVDEPTVAYVEEGNERTAKKIVVPGVLSHGMADSVTGFLRNSEGDISDIVSTSSLEDGTFALEFVLNETIPEGEYKVSVSSPNCNNTEVCSVNVSGLGTEAELLSFSVDGVNGGKTANGYNVTFNSYKDLSQVIPIFSVSKGASVYINGTEQVSGSSKVNLSSGGVVYTVISETLKIKKDFVITASIKSSNKTDRPSNGGGGGGGGSYIGQAQVSPDTKPVVMPVTQPEIEFSDMTGYEWAEEYVKALCEKGIVSGTGDNKFSPEKNVTRAEFVKMLVIAFDIKGSKEMHFADLAKGDWAYPYVEAAYANGIVKGITDNLFGKDEAVTRQDMAVMAYRAAEHKGKIEDIKNTESFSDDNLISDYAHDAVYYMKACGIINGVGENRFNPLGLCTRAEAAKVICLFIQ